MTCQSFDCSNGLNPKQFGCCGTTKVTKCKNKKQFQKDVAHYETKIAKRVKQINDAKQCKNKCVKSYHEKVNAWKKQIDQLNQNIFQAKKAFKERKIVKVACVKGQSCCGCC